MNLDALISAESSESSIKIKVEILGHGRSVHYLGTKDDLIAEGYATEAMFPKNPRGSRSGETDYVPCRRGSVHYRWQTTGKKDGRFNLYTTWTEWID